MKKYYISVFSVVILSTLIGSSNIGITPRISGLENDSVYMELLLEETVLKNKEDSLLNLLDEKRTAFMRDTSDRAMRSAEILSLEADLFDIRNNLGIVVSKTTIIEQEYLINSLENELPDSPSPINGTDNRFLPYNSYIKNNLNKEDYELLLEVFDNEKYISGLSEEFISLYTNMEETAILYKSAEDQYTSDSLYNVYRGLYSGITECEEDFNKNWEMIFNTKTLVYTFLLDKLNKLADINEINRRNKAEKIPAEQLKTMISETFAEFPSQYRLISEYEILLARTLNLASALDSLTQAISGFDDSDFIKQNIILAERDFIDFAGISKVQSSPYNNQNPIPEINVPEKGKFYSITVGTFANKPAVSTFKNIVPVHYDRNQGRYRYFIGLYKTLTEAYADAVKLKNEHGFRKPEVVMWDNGDFKNLGSDIENNAGAFNVEIEGIGKLNDAVRSYIDRYAHDKEIILVNGKYFIGIFSNRLTAQEFAGVLNTIPLITASVTAIE